MLYPDWKILLARKHIESGAVCQIQDVNDIISVLNKTAPPEATEKVMQAFDIYDKDMFVREIIEACMLSDDYSLEECSDLFGIPADILAIYSCYFFDIKVFKYKLQKYEYVRTYENSEMPDSKLYKTWALSVGMDFFRWKFNPTNFESAPKKVLGDLITDTFFRAKEHINESITSATAKESLKWIKQAVDSIGGLKALESNKQEDELNKFFKTAIEYKDDTRKSDDIVDAEIIE